jgi:hypothetical protein
MSFLSNLLPPSIFGHRLPWAPPKEVSEPQQQPETTPTEQETAQEETKVLPPSIFDPPKPRVPPEKISDPQEQPDAPPAEQEIIQETPKIEPPLGQSIHDSLLQLKLEQFSSLAGRAGELHEKSKALNIKIRSIDDVLSLIQQELTENPNKPLDCSKEALRQARDILRAQGIRVPLPEKTLELGQLGNFFTVMGNQRSLLADELKEHSSEFQQCTVERNTLLQHLMTMVTSQGRVISKISSNLTSR